MITISEPIYSSREEFEEAMKVYNSSKRYRFPRIYFQFPKASRNHKRKLIKYWEGKLLLPNTGEGSMYCNVKLERELFFDISEAIAKVLIEWTRKHPPYGHSYLDCSIDKIRFSKHYCFVDLNT